MQPLRSWLARYAPVACMAFAISACGTASSPPDDDEGGVDAVADGSGAGVPDAGEADTMQGADTAPDASSNDDTADDADECTTTGCPCDVAADCDSGYCVQNGDEGRVCADPCGDGCADGAACVSVDVGGTATELCLPEAYPYCDDCSTDGDCGGFGACVELADGNKCAPTCGEFDLCPVGSTCTTTATDAGDVEVCVPDAGQCIGCIDPDGDEHGVGPGCLGIDCNEEDEAINEGAEELCDGIDNNCNGREDEGFDFANDPNNCLSCGNVCSVDNGTASCVLGQCRVASCDEGWGDCNGDDDDGCEEDLLSDSFCGVCSEDTNRPGDPCGICASGAYACQDDGSVACEGDLGDDAYNTCGGCGDLEGEPGTVCEGTGEWRCADEETVTCIFPGEVAVTTADDVIADDGLCSLRELIIAANTGVEVDTCGVATDVDIVRFDVVDATIRLAIEGRNEDAAATGDLDVLVPLTLEANGATTIDGAGLDRLFDIQAGGSLTLRNITLINGTAQGDSGTREAAGVGAGFGGAVRALGDFTCTGCVFANNTAVGGDGGQDTAPSGGGGGAGGAGLGGAIFADGVSVSLSASTLSENAATGGNGANGAANGGSFSGQGAGGGGADGGAPAASGAGNPGGFGGGGGGGANDRGTNGGNGGFGGGGGGGGANASGGNTGDGGAPGFGGGGGGTGCCSASAGGGGGAGLGGAIFARGGAVTLTDCTVSSNTATGGTAGRNHFGGGSVAPGAGEGYGGGVFLDGAVLTEAGTTIRGNTAATDGSDRFDLAE